jgi:predicted PurR-regulated permease PerM
MADPPTGPEDGVADMAAPDAPLPPSSSPPSPTVRMPRWVWRAVAIFWMGWLVTLALRHSFARLNTLIVILLVSLFLALAIEPGVNLMVRRGVRRGRATGLILLMVIVFAGVFVGAIGTLVGSQIADLLNNSKDYVNRTVVFLNDNFGTNIDAQDCLLYTSPSPRDRG